MESVYEQGVPLELLVIDDGSTDHTESPVMTMWAARTFGILRMNRIWERQVPETEESDGTGKIHCFSGCG